MRNNSSTRASVRELSMAGAGGGACDVAVLPAGQFGDPVAKVRTGMVDVCGVSDDFPEVDDVEVRVEEVVLLDLEPVVVVPSTDF